MSYMIDAPHVLLPASTILSFGLTFATVCTDCGDDQGRAPGPKLCRYIYTRSQLGPRVIYVGRPASM